MSAIIAAIGSFLLTQGAPLAVGYIVPRVTQKLGASFGGRLLLWVIEKKLKPRQSAADSLLEKLGKDVELTKAQRAKLTEEELNILDHGRNT